MRRILIIGGLFGLLICAIWLAAPAPISRAQIIIDPPPTAWPPPWPEPQPQLIDQVKIQEQRVDVTVDGVLAQVQLTQILRNDSPRPIEGTYVFPLPPDATISDFQMTVDDQVIEGEILRADEARRTYEEIVRQRRDPALLEYLGRDLFQVSVFPIPGKETRTLTLSYSQVLTQREGLYQFRYPLLARQITTVPIESLVLNIELINQPGLRTIYSPNYTIDVERLSDKRARIGYEERDATPTGDFTLYFGNGDKAVGVNVLSYHPTGEDGYFLMMAAPSVEVAAGEVIARDIIMVIDVSGSMQGEKMAQAQAAANYVVEQLNGEDRFNLISFSTGVRLWQSALQPVTAANRTAAGNWIEQIVATGSTDINRALLEAVGQIDAGAERPTYLIFLTDGLPTQGERDVERILANVENNLPTGSTLRLFAFGVGYDVNTTLLDTLSSDMGGRSSYVRPDERIDEEVSHFYNGISTPVLSNVTVEFGDDLIVDEIYPFPLPDLFAGEQLVVAGRYRMAQTTTSGDGVTTDITLQGTVNGETVLYHYPAQSFGTKGGESTVARLWASRKIGSLLQAIRRNGPDQEVIDAIIELSLQYGIVTPYTSAYVPEPIAGAADGAVPLSTAVSDAVAEASGAQAQFESPQITRRGDRDQATADMSRASGERAVALSDTINELETAEVVAEQRAVRYVAGKSFVPEIVETTPGNPPITRWVDTEYDEAMTVETVIFGSACYFNLLDNAVISEWLSVAPDLIVVISAKQALLIITDAANEAATEAATDASETCPSFE